MKMNFDKDWKFYLGNLSPTVETEGWGGAKARAYSFGATAKELNDSAWRSLDLPHDFVSEGDYGQKRGGSDMQQIPEMESMDSRLLAGGSIEGGVAWYRKHFTMEKEKEEQRFLLHFGGIYRNSTIYLNEYYVGQHKNGYSSFTLDITDFLDFESENVLAIRVDATGREGWWYEGGGIYRHVYIEEKQPAYIAPHGVYAATPHVDDEKNTADLRIRTEIVNQFFEKKSFEVNTRIFDADHSVIGSISGSITLEAWESKEIEQTIFLQDCRLWSLEDPYLYNAEVVLSEAAVALDYEKITIGIRHMEWNAKKGFLLNGKPVRIQGLCCHQDHAGVGIAMPDEVVLFRLQQMKGMGMNAYRSAHHMAAEEVLNICDRLGILVMDETRRMSSAMEDIEEVRQVVRTGRNHPSVVIWGIGNEEVFCQDRPEMIRGTKSMTMEVKKLDDTRPITSAVVCWNGKERFDTARRYLPVTKHLDVMGFNYCKSAWDDYHECMPEQPILITEASTNSWTRGCYSTNEAKGEYFIYDPENERKCKSGLKAKKADVAESEWKYVAKRPYLGGVFLWTGMDYRGEPTPLSYPAVYSQFGIFDYCGFEKDNYYYYKSWWQEKEDVLHVFPHWNHPDKIGEALRVYCYSNAEEVELYVNEKSYGRKAMEKNWYLRWEEVLYQPGVLKAVGYRNNKKVSEYTVRTTGDARRIAMEQMNTDKGTALGTAKESALRTAQESIPGTAQESAPDTYVIKVSIVDDELLVVPTANHSLTFQVDGAGKLLGTGNGNPGDHDSEKTSARQAYHGLCELLVRRTGTGPIRISTFADGLVSAMISIIN